jgi:hypothetical protein
VGKSGPKAPESPNYAALIPLQEDSNLRQFNTMLEAMRPTQVTPYGTQSWDYNQGTFNRAGYQEAEQDYQAKLAAARAKGWTGENIPKPRRNDFYEGGGWTFNQSLSPEQQQLYDADIASKLQQSTMLEGLTERANATAGQDFNPGALPDMQGSLTKFGDKLAGLDSGQFYDKAADALYRQQQRYLDPEQERAKRETETRLAEQGFVPGTPGYNQAMDSLNMSRERAYGDARDRSLLMGTTVGQQMFQNERGLLQDQMQEELQGAQFGNQARNQALSEALALRQLPMNELNAFRTGAQVQLPNLPAQYNVPQLQGVDRIGAAQQDYQNQLGAYNAGQAGSNNLMSGLFGLGSAALLGPMGGALAGMLNGGAGSITGGSGFRLG